MRVHSIGIILALGLALTGAPAFAAPFSGGGSGGGAIEGGSGAPGGGVGIPGAIAAGVGEDGPAPSYMALATVPVMAVGPARTGALHHLNRRIVRQGGF